jgi:outer membrane protein assembly factor BamB
VPHETTWAVARAAIAVALVLLTLAVLAAPARAAEQQAYAVAMNYATPTVNIGEGDKLTFNNLDQAAKHDLVGDDGEFGSDLLGSGESGPVRGVERLDAGQYQFHCSLHGWMKGVLNVSPAGSAPGVPSPGGGGTGQGHMAPDPIDIWPQATPEKLGRGRWHFYGRDLRNSRDGGRNGPSKTDVPKLGPAWSFHSRHGDFTGTPVVVGNTVVTGSNGGYLFALNARTGRQRWRRKVGRVVNGSVAVSRGRVFVPIAEPNRPRLAAYRLKTGKRLWSRRLSRQKDSDVYGSPVVWRNTVVMGTSALFGELNNPQVRTRGTVVALNARTGKVRWRTYNVPRRRDGGAVWTTPAVDKALGRF